MYMKKNPISSDFISLDLCLPLYVVEYLQHTQKKKKNSFLNTVIFRAMLQHILKGF